MEDFAEIDHVLAGDLVAFGGDPDGLTACMDIEVDGGGAAGIALSITD
jgi:hypothetical protein